MGIYGAHCTGSSAFCSGVSRFVENVDSKRLERNFEGIAGMSPTVQKTETPVELHRHNLILEVDPGSYRVGQIYFRSY